MRHFLTRGEHKEQVAICPHGPKRVSLFISEHTIHSSKVSESLLIIEGLREPTWPLIKENISNQVYQNIYITNSIVKMVLKTSTASLVYIKIAFSC